MKEDPIDVDEDYDPQGKRTRKRKVQQLPLPLPNRSTRRAHRKHSSDECPLPEQIPLSDGLELLLFQSFERELTRLVLQLPHPLLLAPAAASAAHTRVEAWPVEVQARAEGGSVAVRIRAGGELPEQAALVVHGKYCWLGEGEVVSKVIKNFRRPLAQEEWSELVRFRPEGARSDGFVVLTLRWEERVSKLHRGLVNQGNTCYMNSYLQMLFHLAEFRRLLFAAEVKEKDRFPATLQLLFYRMLSEERPVSPEDLVRSFGWSKKEVQVQHDAQEFSCLFFDALQRTIQPKGGQWASVPDLFCGELVHYIQCCNVGTAEFRTQNRERFYDLQLPLAPTLAHALHDYVAEQKLQADNAYRTEYYGMQDAHKGLKLSSLPPVLMLQLKRFQFNAFTEANEKMLDRCAYPQSIDFAPWTLEPSQPQPYELYAVLVHEGSQASSGHYYVFIRLQGQWFRFNDERVQQVDRAHALDYNFGGGTEVVQFESKQLRVAQRQVQNKATAYMLVYLSSHHSHQLTAEDSRLPEWLVEHTRMKLSLDEEKKLRKQSICDIPLLRWRDMEGRECQGSGLAVAGEEGGEERIEMVPKNMRVEDWLGELGEGESEGEKTGCLYILWTVLEREAVVNIRLRSTGTVSDLFKDIPDPTVFFAPIEAEKEEFLVVVKVYDPSASPKFAFAECLTIKKDSRRGELLSLLATAYPDSTYFLEDRKHGLVKLAAGDSDLLPAASPSRNQLLVAVVQLAGEGPSSVEQLYVQELDSVAVVFRNQASKESIEMELSRRLTARELREILFAEINNEAIKSPDNIVLKYKAKRNAKPTSEAQDQDRLADLVRVDKVILYGHSALNAQERNRLREVTLHCRDQSLRLSEPIQLLVERAEQERLLELAQLDQRVQAFLPHRKGYFLRSFLLGRDRSFITDVVDEAGRVPSKGELAVVLERDRNSVLVIEQAEVDPLKPEERMQVLLHHVTKTGERFGPPRVFSLPRSIPLIAMRAYLLEQIEAESYEFEGKTYSFNPFKLRLVAYLKDQGKGVELLEEGMQPEPTAEQGRGKNGVAETLEGKFAKSKFVRVAVTHSYIAKGSQVLKLNVE